MRAIKAARQWCEEHGVLAEFLKENSSEVDNMLITDQSFSVFLTSRSFNSIVAGYPGYCVKGG
jgi:hypothetical protein